MPHARIPNLRQPIVMLGISREGIDWDAVDDVPAHLIFLVLTSEEQAEAQLEILSTIARAFSDERARRSLAQARTGREAMGDLQRYFLRAG